MHRLYTQLEYCHPILRVSIKTALENSFYLLDEYSYAYDAAGQRTSVQRVDGATVNYGYDDIGEVVSAV